MSKNPYQTPGQIATSPSTLSSSKTGLFWNHLMVQSGAKFIFWCGVVHWLMGSVISFVPGGEFSWFAFTSVLFAVGILVNRVHYRLASLLLLWLCLQYAYSGYLSGIKYERSLQDRELTVEKLIKDLSSYQSQFERDHAE